MLIDWFTVGAQALNFLILVWLLKRFLYRPVLAAIDAREKKIAAQLDGAARAQAQAQSERDEFQRRDAALNREREQILRAASETASRERDRLVEGAREEAQALREKLLGVVATEREDLGRRIRTRTREEVLLLTRRILRDLAGVEIEQRMVEVFLAQLRELTPEQRQQIPRARTAGSRSGGEATAVVESGFELTTSQREGIVREIDGAVEFVTSSDLVCGIELTVGGVKLAWSVADYLTCVSQELLALVDPVSGNFEPARDAEAQHARR